VATFRLPTGGHVHTFPTPQRTGVEFVTYNEAGDVISTVCKSRTNALPMLASLRRADALACRFKSAA
jgi:hypothetical protein